MLGIIVVDPLEPPRYKIELVQSGCGAVKLVEIAYQALNPSVQGVIQQMPIQALVVVPFTHLRKFAAHKHQLLARMAEHETIISP